MLRSEWLEPPLSSSDPEHSTRSSNPLDSSLPMLEAAENTVNELEFMVDHIYRMAYKLGWTETTKEVQDQEVVLVRSHHGVSMAPNHTISLKASPLYGLVENLQMQAVLVMKGAVVQKILNKIPPMNRQVKFIDERAIDVYDSLQDAMRCVKVPKSGYLVIRDPPAVLVWTPSAKDLIDAGRRCFKTLNETLQVSENSSTWLLWDDECPPYQESESLLDAPEGTPQADAALESQKDHDRHSTFIWPLTVSITWIISGLIIGQLLSGVVLATLKDGGYQHLIFIPYLPIVIMASSFFLSIIVVGVFQLLGPIAQISSNSTAYSGERIKTTLPKIDMPHFTIQCPVYKEDISTVLDPTFESVQEAIATYEAQGGTASIVVNDDGMRLLDSMEQMTRKEYYRRKNIGWTARPANGEDGYIRAGAFKKASNLNFGMRASISVEQAFESIASSNGSTLESYHGALQSVIDSSAGELLADGDIGLGDLILLIDADTRVPKDCFLDAAKEFRQTPSLAILQHASGVLQVVNNFWENGLAHFTRNNYFGTKYVVASGDTTPFFGHNAFLRFSALDDIADTEENGTCKWWSESHVSEDFELSLKLLSAGYSSRLVGYSDYGFQEGVCLTVNDEINRWEKYAFGVCELMLHPCRRWLHRGPFTPLFRHFIGSSMDLSAKCSSLFYMCTYFAIGMAWPMCVVNYFYVGWWPFAVRSYYVNCLNILLAVTVIFGLKDAVVGPIIQYRLKEVPLGRGLLNAMSYFVIVTLFLQGISMHVSKCLVWHLCGLKMQWGATNKSLQDDATLLMELPRIWRRFRFMYVTVFILSTTVIVVAFVVPTRWRITDIRAVLPMVWMLFWHAAVPLLMHSRSFLADIYRGQSHIANTPK